MRGDWLRWLWDWDGVPVVVPELLQLTVYVSAEREATIPVSAITALSIPVASETELSIPVAV